MAVEVPVRNNTSDQSNMGNASSPIPTPSSQNQLNTVLPEPNCLIWDAEQGCIFNKQETIIESCTSYRSALNLTPSIQEIGQPETCQIGTPDTLDLQSTEAFINYLRSRTGHLDINLATNDEYANCALMANIEYTDDSWDYTSRCYTEELNAYRQFSSSKIYGTWSLISGVNRSISANRSDTLGFRNAFLKPSLYRVNLGINGGVSCIGLEYVSNVSTPINFSFYPGVGQIPIEMINPGNHAGKSVPWSMSIDDQDAEIKDLNVYLITSDRETPVSIVNLNLAETVSNTMTWQVNPAPQIGQMYKVSVTWENGDRSEERRTDLYLAFNDCGYQMPRTCDPNRTDQCIVPGKECIYFRFPDAEENWFCLAEGPRQIDEDCSDYPPACQGGMVCSNTGTENSCRPFCSLDDSLETACNRICDDYFITEVASIRIGVCN